MQPYVGYTFFGTTISTSIEVTVKVQRTEKRPNLLSIVTLSEEFTGNIISSSYKHVMQEFLLWRRMKPIYSSLSSFHVLTLFPQYLTTAILMGAAHVTLTKLAMMLFFFFFFLAFFSMDGLTFYKDDFFKFCSSVLQDFGFPQFHKLTPSVRGDYMQWSGAREGWEVQLPCSILLYSCTAMGLILLSVSRGILQNSLSLTNLQAATQRRS